MKETPFLAGREDCLANLRRMNAFVEFDDEHLKTVLAHSRIRKYEAGEVVLLTPDKDVPIGGRMF